MAGRPQEIIDSGALSVWQLLAIATTVLLNALDGFDAAVISFAAPGIAAEWHVPKDVLGWVLSMELIGMAAGSVLLGGLADRIGRRPTIVLSLSVMAAGMYLVTTAANVTELSVWRLLTGFGIGGMLSALTAVVAEYSNRRWRNLLLAVMIIGYPLGAIVGGAIARGLLKSGDWRAVFEFGAFATAITIVLALILIPETPAHIFAKRPKDALARINRTLARFHLPVLDALTDPEVHARRQSMLDILRPGLLRTTVLMTIAYVSHVTCYYFILKWIPKLVVDMGFDAGSAADVLIGAMTGNAIGGLALGFVTQKLSLRKTTAVVLCASCVMVNVFANGPANLPVLIVLAGMMGFCINAAGVGFYTLLAHSYPTHVRGTGTGFVIGVGRAGAAMGPAIGGMLFAQGMTLPQVALLLATGSLIAALAVWNLKPLEEDQVVC